MFLSKFLKLYIYLSNDKLQFVLCGFDVRGSLTTINPQTGEETTRPIKPEESIWHQYEKIFTKYL